MAKTKTKKWDVVDHLKTDMVDSCQEKNSFPAPFFKG